MLHATQATELQAKLSKALMDWYVGSTELVLTLLREGGRITP